MHYPVAIERGDVKHAYGVVVPDLPGCFSAGDSMDEALANAREAILLHLEGLLDAGEPLPAPMEIAAHQGRKEFAGWIWAVVPVDMKDIDDAVERINVTIPRRVLRVIDAAAAQAGTSRSGYLVESAMRQQLLVRQNSPAYKSGVARVKRGRQAVKATGSRNT